MLWTHAVNRVRKNPKINVNYELSGKMKRERPKVTRKSKYKIAKKTNKGLGTVFRQ